MGRTLPSQLLGSAGSMEFLVRRVVCARLIGAGIRFCFQLQTTPTFLAGTMLSGVASMNVRASAIPIIIMVGISVVTVSHICMNLITGMATCLVMSFTMAILAIFASKMLAL